MHQKMHAFLSNFCGVQVFPAVAADGNDHGCLADDFVQNARPGTDNDVIDDPQGGIDEHAADADLPGIVGVAADGGGNIGGNGQDGPPAAPGEKQGRHLQRAENPAHGLAFQKRVFAAQAERPHGIQNVTDAAGHRPQHQQVGGIAKIGKKLDTEKILVAFALKGQKKQSRSQYSDGLDKKIL